MRIAWAVVLAGCFAPSPPANVPCDPNAAACPSGERCVASPNGFVCSDHDLGTIDAPLGSDAPAPDAPASSVTKMYPAAVAECQSGMIPSAMLCRQINGNEQLVIDTVDAMTMDAWHGFLRFNIDNALVGKTITKVTLKLTATNDAKAPGPDSGSVFAVSAFTLASLEMAIPTKLGQLAGSQGAVTLNATVSWNLPTTTVAPNSSVYLGIYPNSDDGVNFWNVDGVTKPVLVVQAQ